MKRFPVVTFVLVLANLSAYVWERAAIAAGGDPCGLLGLVPERFIASGNWLPVLASSFLHDPNSLTHLVGNMAALLLVGLVVERAIGHARFAVLYLASGILGALLHVAVDPHSSIALVGASGCVAGVLAVLGAIRSRLIGFAAGFLLVNVWWAWTGTAGTVSFATHIGGFAAGAALVVVAGAHGTVEEWRFA